VDNLTWITIIFRAKVYDDVSINSRKDNYETIFIFNRED
jgi:hypothetical protein